MRIAVLLAAGAIVATALPADGAVRLPAFAQAVTVANVTTASGKPELQDIGAADLNGDGITDVLAIRARFDNPQAEPISIEIGDGKGHFTDQTARIFDGAIAKTLYPRRIVFADFNGDGRTDVFIADTGPDTAPFPGWSNTLILSAPGGKLVDASANLPRDADFTHSAAAADVDHNGTVDLYAGNLVESRSGTRVPPEILLNDGSAHFTVAADALPQDIGSRHYDGAGFADVNGDSAPDLVLLGSPGNPNRLLLNDGAGRFHDSATPLPPKPWGTDNSEGLTVTAVDINGDGRLDLLAGYTKNTPFYKGNWLQVLVNDGAGGFVDETATRLPQTDNEDEWPVRVEVADLNGDGKPDIGMTKWWYPSAAPSFWLNRGDGTFTALTPTALRTLPPTFVFLDANRDGRLDVYAAASGGTESHVLSLQTVAKPKPARKCTRKPMTHRCK